MNVFQIVLIACGLILLAGLVAASVRGRASAREAIALGLLITIGVLAAVWPEMTTTIARKLGIRRGADLISYLTTLVMLVGFVMVYIRLRKLRRDVTILVRELAIARAHEGSDVDPAPPPPGSNGPSGT